MRALAFVLVTLIVALQYPLWLGKGGWLQLRETDRQLALQREANEELKSRNAALDTVRARHTISVAEIFGTNVTTGGEDAPERARSLHAAFATLPEDQRQVVVLRHVLGLSPVEIAEQLGRTSSSV